MWRPCCVQSVAELCGILFLAVLKCMGASVSNCEAHTGLKLKLLPLPPPPPDLNQIKNSSNNNNLLNQRVKDTRTIFHTAQEEKRFENTSVDLKLPNAQDLLDKNPPSNMAPGFRTVGESRHRYILARSDPAVSLAFEWCQTIRHWVCCCPGHSPVDTHQSSSLPAPLPHP